MFDPKKDLIDRKK